MILPPDAPLADKVLLELALRDRPITIGRLADWLLVPRREMEECLEQIAKGGQVALVADGRGVRIASDPDEVDAYLRSLRHRMASMYQRIRSLRQVERRMRGVRQMEMFR